MKKFLSVLVSFLSNKATPKKKGRPDLQIQKANKSRTIFYDGRGHSMECRCDSSGSAIITLSILNTDYSLSVVSGRDEISEMISVLESIKEDTSSI